MGKAAVIDAINAALAAAQALPDDTPPPVEPPPVEPPPVEPPPVEPPPVEPPPVEPPPVEPPPAQLDVPLFDGPMSGVDRDHWNKKVPVKWRQRCGDWVDAAGVEHGGTPFATIACAPGAADHAVDVTALVRDQPNTGIMLRSAGPSAFGVKFAGRTSAMPPRLTVVTGGGTLECPCTATAYASATTSGLLDGRTQFIAQPNNYGVAMLQFDTSAVQGTVQSASMHLHQDAMGGSGKTTVEVYRIVPPKVIIGGGGAAPQLGIAAAYPHDVGIAAHQDVLFAADFTSVKKWPDGPWDAAGADGGWRNEGFQQVTLPSGRVAVRYGFKGMPDPTVIDNVALGGGSFAVNLWTGVDTTTYPYPVPMGAPEEIFFRYYVLLENDWGDPGAGGAFWNDGGYKMPGIGFRWGRWRPMGGYRMGGYWQSLSGNGGQPPSGRVQMNSNYGGGPAMHGGSARGHGDGSQWDGNPLDHCFAAKHYIYHPDQMDTADKWFSGYNGVEWRWGAMLTRNRWHCVEQRVRMNSVDTSSLDAYGNGVGRRDGVIETWIDGVRAGMIDDIRFRHHPLFGIENVWLVWLHGGKSPASNILRDMHYQMTDVVIARSYIGPRA